MRLHFVLMRLHFVLMRLHFVLVVFLLACVCSGSDSIDSFIQNRTFIFISGWPQSGTSFIHQVFTLHPDISTMVENCEKILGKRCVNWNHEGQWLIPGNARKVINSGVMCPHDGNATTDEASMVLSEWQKYWDDDKIFMVEKSPPSFLKIHLLRNLFRAAKSVKFIILMKHPVTLNVAVPKGYTWTQRKVLGQSGSPEDQRPLTVPERNLVATFFADMMVHDNSTQHDQRSPKCSMGWLPAMQHLHRHLLSDPLSRRDIRVVRFESFNSPLGVCKSLFAFAMGIPTPARGTAGNNNNADLERIYQICSRQFGASAQAATASTVVSATLGAASARLAPKPVLAAGAMGRGGLQGKNGHKSAQRRVQVEWNNTSGAGGTRWYRTATTDYADGDAGDRHQRSNAFTAPSAWSRNLRLRTSQEQASAAGFHFLPELVAERGRARVRDFTALFHALGPKLKARLEVINAPLKQFGYDLFQWQPRSVAPSILKEWEL